MENTNSDTIKTNTNLGLNAPLLHLVDNHLHNSEKYVVLKKDTKISNTSKT